MNKGGKFLKKLWCCVGGTAYIQLIYVYPTDTVKSKIILRTRLTLSSSKDQASGLIFPGLVLKFKNNYLRTFESILKPSKHFRATKENNESSGYLLISPVEME